MMTTKATTATISAILKNPRDGGFVSDSLVYRYPPQPRIDGLPGEESTFNMCSFWIVEALTRSSLALPEKLDQARLLFERVLGYANHLGLYGEQTGQQGETLGNFPQAKKWTFILDRAARGIIVVLPDHVGEAVVE